MTGPPRPRPPTPRALDWAGVALIAVLAGLAGMLEALLVPLYLGTTIAPVTIVLALVSNAALPRMAYALVPKTMAAAVPFLAWLVVMIGFGSTARPEGDVILPGSPGSLAWVTYATLLGGALVAAVTIVWLAPPPRRKDAPQPSASGAGRVNR